MYQRQIEEECAGNFDESVCLQEGKSVTQLVHRGQQLWLADSVLHVSFAWPRHYRRCLQEHATDVLSVEGSVDFGNAKAWCYAGNSNAVNETSPTVLVKDTICEHMHLEPIQARDTFGSDLPTSAICATHGIRLQETSNPRSIQSSKRDCPVLQVVQGLSEQLRDTVKKREHACVALVAILQFRTNCEDSGVEAASREAMI